MGTEVKTLVPGSELFQGPSKTYTDVVKTLVPLPCVGLGLMRLAGSAIAQRIDDPRIVCRATG